jgi:hypothetical protein
LFNELMTHDTNAQCTITVQFEPLEATSKVGGTRSAAIILDWGYGPQLIPVSGFALTDLNPSPASLSFGKVPVGQTSATKTVTLTNNTGADVFISPLPLVPGFNVTGCSGAVANGSFCTISIAFAPTTKGHQAGTLTITDNAVNSPQTVSLQGTGN